MGLGSEVGVHSCAMHVSGVPGNLFVFCGEEAVDAGTTAVEPAGRREQEGDAQDVRGEIENVVPSVVGGLEGTQRAESERGWSQQFMSDGEDFVGQSDDVGDGPEEQVTGDGAADDEHGQFAGEGERSVLRCGIRHGFLGGELGAGEVYMGLGFGAERRRADQSLRALRSTPAFGRAVAPSARLFDAGTEVPAYPIPRAGRRVRGG